MAGFRNARSASSEAACGFDWAAAQLASRDLSVVHERIFGSLSVEKIVRAKREAAFRGRGISLVGPVTYIDGRPPWGEGLAGWIIHAVRRTALDSEPRVLTEAGRAVGRMWSMGGTRFATLQGLYDGDGPARGGARGGQVRRTLEMANRLLREQGFQYSEVVRTWFWLGGILDWYGEFNQARTQMYGDLGLVSDARCGSPPLPASTGIGGKASHGGACTLDLVCVSPGGSPGARVRRLSSPTQPEPMAYGSSFSRGAVVGLPGAWLIHVSGTAALDEAGRSVFPGDARSQIRHTLDTVESLLAPEGACLADIVAATAYVKRPEDAGAFYAELAGRDLAEMPVVCVVADICRDELLFEIDAEAVIPRRGAGAPTQAASET